MDEVLPEWSSALASDALDELGARGRVLDAGLRPLVQGTVLAGPVLTVRVETTETVADPDDPYRGEIRAVGALRPGHVPLYVAPGDNRAALWGELFSHAALAMGAAGAIVDGCVRDTRQVRALGFPVFARGTSPLDTLARASVCEVGGLVHVGDVEVTSGDFVVADDDGVVVIPAGLLPEVRAVVEARRRDEAGARADLGAGRTLAAVWQTWGAL
ncbi:RraA family protein [Jiangella mangrovi]|uniref:Putative 4-hydroxy-4-methyl-2-oxoglutarate aldolase n=1 Tax=Jiangella mangrovi TaxID=1524084 RepID=A0A7W9GXR2_9ACTN|nr:RraA family protein [Jiangella mangrovi]MBB5791693.1 regulator of RNase E activity RraA [Jiangella mangrovi]